MVTARSVARGAIAAVRARIGSFVAVAVALQGFALLVRQSLALAGMEALPAAELAASIAIDLAILLAMLGVAATCGARTDAPSPGVAIALAASVVALAKLVAAGTLLGFACVAATAAVTVPLTLLAAELLPDEPMPGVPAVAAIGFVAAAGAAWLGVAARFGALPGVYLFERAPLRAGLGRAFALGRGAAGAGVLLAAANLLVLALAAAPLSLAAIPGFMLALGYGAALGVLHRQLVDTAASSAAGDGREWPLRRAASA